MPGWDWRWHAEIEPFPSAVLDARLPQSVNLGDVNAPDFCDRAAAAGRPDVLVFGSPCQSYSVAGKRLGLDDPRGNLALVALRIVAELRPRWFVFENVPGLLSSGDRRDFGIFLQEVGDIGYCCAWSVLDAQHFGVAQRRKRVFVVGHLGPDWRRAAAVLLEPEGLCGHPPSRSEARQDVTGTLASRTSAGGGLGTDFDLSGGLVAGFSSTGERSHCLNAGGMGRIDYESETLIAHSLRAEGFDAGEDGTGRGTPLVPVAFAHQGGTQTTLGYRPESGTSPALSVGQTPAVAFTAKDYGADAIEELSPTLRSGGHQHSHANGGVMPAVTVAIRGRDGGGTAEMGGPVATALRASQGGGDKPHVLTSGVRRLMPSECERLQGFPDDFTAITYRGKPAADGPRYKAIGNSMAVPVIRWILERVAFVDALPSEEATS